ncbi:MAG: hypothetical protein WC679_01340 [Bacteroidales bacterium]|jgi:hypothetical protein
MGKRTVELLTCDICGKESKSKDKPETWLQWSRDNPMLDRDWIEHCMCPSCIEDISPKIEKFLVNKINAKRGFGNGVY